MMCDSVILTVWYLLSFLDLKTHNTYQIWKLLGLLFPQNFSALSFLGSLTTHMYVKLLCVVLRSLRFWFVCLSCFIIPSLCFSLDGLHCYVFKFMIFYFYTNLISFILFFQLQSFQLILCIYFISLDVLFIFFMNLSICSITNLKPLQLVLFVLFLCIYWFSPVYRSHLPVLKCLTFFGRQSLYLLLIECQILYATFLIKC